MITDLNYGKIKSWKDNISVQKAYDPANKKWYSEHFQMKESKVLNNLNQGYMVKVSQERILSSYYKKYLANGIFVVIFEWYQCMDDSFWHLETTLEHLKSKNGSKLITRVVCEWITSNS